MPPDTQEPSIEQKHFRISIQVAITAGLFCIGTVGAAAAWAQNITNHLANVDASLVQLKDVMKEVQNLNVIQERTLRMEERLQRLEEWRLREAQAGR